MARSCTSRRVALVAVVLAVDEGGTAHAQMKAAPSPSPQPASPLAAPITRTTNTTKATNAFQEAKWPLRFELLAGASQGTGFAVTQPGPIRITLQATGAPLTLTLRRPDGRTIERTGAGSLVLEDAATKPDIERGLFWAIAVRPAQQVAKAPTGIVVRTRPVQTSVATGSIAVEHPAADAARVEAAYRQKITSSKKPITVPPMPPPTSPQADFNAAVVQRQATELQRLRPTIPPDTFTQLDQRMTIRKQGKSLEETVPLQNLSATKQFARSVPVPPVFTSASATEGDPGTPLTLGGSELGAAVGTVHFIVATGRDVIAPITRWSSTQIVTEVPLVVGLPAFDGQVYIERADGKKTTPAAFRFIPQYEVGWLNLPIASDGDLYWDIFEMIPKGKFNDSNVSRGGAFQRWASASGVGAYNEVFGAGGDDEFYLTSRLRNSWVVESAQITYYEPNTASGGAWINDFRPGTDQPYVKVHWWMPSYMDPDGPGQQYYRVGIVVKRPKGLPCSATPCPML